MDLNNVVLIGRLVKDVEIETTNTGKNYCNFSIAVNGYKDDDVSFISCNAWEKTTELLAKYCRKGSKICVEGSLKQDRWEKDGKKQSKTKVFINRVYFLDTKNNSEKKSSENGFDY